MKNIGLDSLPSYTKQELALHQLDRAIRLLLDEDDTISAITLGEPPRDSWRLFGLSQAATEAA
jgi:hypothetical protein